jgi:hypothetical protein
MWMTASLVVTALKSLKLSCLNICEKNVKAEHCQRKDLLDWTSLETEKIENFSISNQPDFIRRILKRYNMEDCNQVSIPADPNNRVNAKMSPNTEEDKREMEKCPVREGIGSLMYLANKSRPDISFAFNQISAFVSNPGYGHWEAIKRVLAFLAWTKNHGICFRRHKSKF